MRLTAATVALALLVPAGASAKPTRPAPSATPPDLAVHWVRDVWQPYELRTASLEGSTTTIASGLQTDSRPSWSPDGTRLAIVLRSITDDATDVTLVTLRPDSSDRQVLLTADAFDEVNALRGVASVRALGQRPFASGTWSPDGSTFVFPGHVRYPAGDPTVLQDDLLVHRLFALDVETSGRGVPTSLREVLAPTETRLTDTAPDWSSNGWLVFVRAPVVDRSGWMVVEGDRELWAVRPDDPSTVRPLYDLGTLPHDHDDVPVAAWSPDARHVALNTNVTAMNGARSGDLWLADVAASSSTIEVTGMHVLRAGATPEWSPTWSPDGVSVAFVERLDARRNFRSRLVVRNVTTGQEQVLLDQTNQTVSYPDWNPAGRSPTW